MSGDDFFDGLDETKAMLRPSGRRTAPSGKGADSWRVLVDIATLFNAPNRAFEDILESVVEAAVKITGADRGFLMLFDEGGELKVKVARNMSYAGLPEEERRVSRSIVEEALKRMEGVFIPNVEEMGQVSDQSSIASLKILSVMCVPLQVTLRGEREARGAAQGSKTLGVLYVDSRTVAEGFDESSLELLEALASQATTAILNSTLYRAATTDQATGLFTRRHFEQRLEDEVRLARRHETPLAVMMVDVDEMRDLNSRYGYKEGDRILARMAEVLQTRIRPADLAARYGGNKFTVLMPQSDQHTARELAALVLQGVRETNFFPDEPVAVRVTVSAGVARYEPGLDAETLVQRADKALFAAKQEGRNQIASYRSELAETARRTDRLAGVFSGDPSRDYRNVLMLLETIEEINKRTSIDELLPLVVDVVIDLAEAERGLLILRRENGGLEVRVARDLHKKDIGDLDFSHSVVQRVIDHDQPVREAFAHDQAAVTQSIGKLDIQAVLCVPLSTHGPGSEQHRTIGALYVDRRERGGEFDEATLAFFDTLARQMSVAIENARLYGRNEELRKQLAQQLDETKKELNTVRIELADREREIEHKYNYDQIIGQSPRMVELFRLLDRITDTAVPVFIHGESGTGKELVANAIHYNGPRRKRRLVSENCAAVTETLLESELFGYMKGAFTGATSDRKGLFEVADGGTLFLDEVGDMSSSMQTKLLRVLQEGEVRRVGGKELIKVDVRIISASNRDLKKLVEAGEFRDDLYYRLNVVKVSLPPLRERKEDIPLLASHFLGTGEDGERQRGFSKEAMQRLLLYHWPGNVRELKNVIDRAKIIADSEVIDEGSIILDAAISPTASADFGMSSMGFSSMGEGLGSLAQDPKYRDLNERQRWLIEYLRQKGSIKNREYYARTKVSKSTGWRDIKDLIKRDILTVHGKGKGSVYTLSEGNG